MNGLLQDVKCFLMLSMPLILASVTLIPYAMRDSPSGSSSSTHMLSQSSFDTAVRSASKPGNSPSTPARRVSWTRSISFSNSATVGIGFEPFFPAGLLATSKRVRIRLIRLLSWTEISSAPQGQLELTSITRKKW